MNWNDMKNQWKGVRRLFKAKWRRLSDKDLMVINGDKEILVEQLQKHYGQTKQQAERRIEEFVRSMQ